MNHKVTINQGRVVPIQFRIFGSLVVLAVMAYSLSNFGEMIAIGICIVVSMLLPLIWSSFYVLQIDPKTKTILDGYWIMGIKKMEQKSYDHIDKIFVNEVTSGQRFTSYAGSVSTVKTKEYAAFLKLSNGQKIFLLSGKNEESINERLKNIYKKLGLDLPKKNTVKPASTT